MLNEPQQLQIDDDGIALRGQLATTRWPWHAFHGWRELERAFVLDLRDRTLVMLPKRAIADQATADQLRDNLQMRIVSNTGGFPINVASDKT